MKRKRWKVIYFALAGSIAAHLLLGPLVHMKFVDAAPEPPAQRIDVFRMKKPTPAPTKPPVRPVQPKPVAHRTVHIHPAMLSHRSDGNKKNNAGPSQPPAIADTGGPPGDGPSDGPGIAIAGPTAAPTIAPTPKPVCSAPFVDASTVSKYTPEVPQLALDQGLSGQAQVKVDLSAEGRVVDATIFQSTGSSLLDRAAVDAAKRTTYAPKVVDCAKVPGSYLFRVEFENN